jgi:cellulose synthase/poly-beta-1,6-N-acetylglucosamine synthase-like glycosyltransferase
VVWPVLGLFTFQLLLLSCFAFFAVFNYLYAFAALRPRRIGRVKHSGRRVAVVIVSYNEKYVLPATIRSCEQLTYPNKVIVLSDDSDDPAIVESLARTAAARGCRFKGTQRPAGPGTAEVAFDLWEAPDFVFLHRASNLGFKGGNLRQVSVYLRAHGINLVYLLDADWHPQPDAIERMLEALEADERTAFVQAKRVTLENGLGLFQRYVAISEEGCYYVDFEGRQAARHPILFSGCCTLLRLDAVEAVGGFAFGHLTEDLDVTNRLWLAGWTGTYCGDVVNHGDVPFSYDDFRRQQERWAYGTAVCLRHYLGKIVRARHLGVLGRLAALRQNCYFSTSVLTASAVLQGFGVVLWLALDAGSYAVEYYLYLVGQWRTPLVWIVYACIFSNLLEPVIMILVKRRRPRDLLHLPMAVWYAWSVLPAHVWGTLKGLLHARTGWFRTPKYVRGELGRLSQLPFVARVVNGTICALLLAMYFVEGWAFGWRDPFALLLVPAFLLATIGWPADMIRRRRAPGAARTSTAG